MVLEDVAGWGGSIFPSHIASGAVCVCVFVSHVCYFMHPSVLGLWVAHFPNVVSMDTSSSKGLGDDLQPLPEVLI